MIGVSQGVSMIGSGRFPEYRHPSTCGPRRTTVGGRRRGEARFAPEAAGEENRFGGSYFLGRGESKPVLLWLFTHVYLIVQRCLEPEIVTMMEENNHWF